MEKIEPVVTAEEFDRIVAPIFLEYFDHSLTKEVEVWSEYFWCIYCFIRLGFK